MTTLQALLIDEDPGARALIRDALHSTGEVNVMAETDSLVYGYELIRQNQPQLVFIDLRQQPEKSLEIIQRIAMYFKDIVVVVSGVSFDIDTIQRCMQAGGREYLRRPFTPDDVINVFQRHRAVLTEHRAGDDTGRIITVFSNKGGLGKTTIAVNTAIALSEISGKPVALVDLNLQMGDVTTFLDITPKQTIVDIARNIGRVDEAYLKSSLSEYKFGNAHLHVLADPMDMEEAEEVTDEQINTVLTIMRSTFEYIVVDASNFFDSRTLTALDLSDNIMLVSVVNLPSIRSTQRMLSLCNRLGYDRQKVKLIVNRYVPGDEITLEDVEDTLGYEIYYHFPNNYFPIMTAINRGVPIAALETGKEMYRQFLDMARQLTGLLPKNTGGLTASLPQSPLKPSSSLDKDKQSIPSLWTLLKQKLPGGS